MKNKHLSFEDRLNIEKGLMERKSFKEIAKYRVRYWVLCEKYYVFLLLI